VSPSNDEPDRMQREPRSPNDLPPAQTSVSIDDKSAAVLSQALQVEQQRIASTDKRTDVAALAIRSQNEQHKREIELEERRLSADNSHRDKVFKLFTVLLLMGAIAGIGMVAFLVYFMFYGDAEQKNTAETIGRILGTGIGGFGVLEVARRIIQRILRR
jgi:hypothetical protein